jgi:iron complex outermembrane receptor protein
MNRNAPAHLIRPTGIALAVATLAALMGSAAAWAQNAPAPAGAASAPAAARTSTARAEAEAAAAKAGTVIEITGTRSSIQGSIARKRTSSTVSDSIVAEDIDQFPDKNVGEALSRVTGVQLTRQFGEGSQVSIRGVEPDLNRVEVNGVSVLSTNGSGGRGAELRELAAELISSIDVVKGSTADLTEGGVGGTVMINTRKPLEFKKPTLAMSLAGQSASSRGGVQPRLNLLLADRYLDGKLGLMANIIYDDVFTRNDYSRNTSWTFLRDWDFSAEKTLTSLNPTAAAVTSAASCASLATAALRTECQRQWFDYAPRISRYGIWTRDHKRASAELTGQYRFTPEFDAYVSYQANTQAQKLNDRNFGTDLIAVTRLNNAGNAPVYNAATGVPTTAGTCAAAPTATTPSGMTVQDHHVTEYTVGSCNYVAGVGGQGAFSTAARNFALDIESKYLTTGFTYKNDLWKITGLVADSRSDYESQSNNIVLTQNAPGLKVTLDSQRLPHFTFAPGTDPENASSYVQAQLQFRPSATKNTERQGKLDFQYNLNMPLVNRLWFGGQARESTSKQYNGGGYLASTGTSLTSTADDVNVMTANINQTFTYDPYYTGTAQRAPDTQSFINSNFSSKYINATQMAALVNSMRERSPGTFFKGFNGISNVPSSWMAPNYDAAAPSFDTSAFNYNNLYNAPGSDGKIYPQIPAFDIKEKTQAGYARLDFDTEVAGLQVDGNFGVRYARTNVKSAGLSAYRQRVASSPGSSTFTDVNLTNSIVSIDNTYSDVLPSVNGTLHLLGDKLLVRTGFAKVMARPALNLLAPNVTCTIGSGLVQFAGDGTDDCTAGNPDLKPYRANKYDLSLEFYPSRDTQVSAAFFRTDIKTYVRTGVLTRGVDFFKDGNLFDVTSPVNGEGARTQGIELAGRTAFTFLPGWASGFGADLNVTRMDYKYAEGSELLNALDGTVLPYPGMSKTAYNVGLWYDQGLINARLAYHMRGSYYTGANDVSGNPNFADKTGYLDAKIQFRISPNMTVSFEGKNLTDQAELTYSGSLARPNELAFSGRRYYVSVGYKL